MWHVALILDQVPCDVFYLEVPEVNSDLSYTETCPLGVSYKQVSRERALCWGVALYARPICCFFEQPELLSGMYSVRTAPKTPTVLNMSLMFFSAIPNRIPGYYID
jgi:hypothetical protein